MPDVPNLSQNENTYVLDAESGAEINALYELMLAEMYSDDFCGV